jgi:four helix bundle suffix protein
MSNDGNNEEHDRLRPSGGYRDLRAFQTTTVIYDGTVAFCDKYIRSHKQHDQMTQAARTGRQNIGEGSRANATSGATEHKLTNVARASLDELLLDYEDFLRQKGHRQWKKDDPEAMEVRVIAKHQADNQQLAYADYARWLDHEDPALRANCLICLIHQANYLLDRLITKQERSLIEEGGFREQLTKARLAERDRHAGLPPYAPPNKAAMQAASSGGAVATRSARERGSTNQNQTRINRIGRIRPIGLISPISLITTD